MRFLVLLLAFAAASVQAAPDCPRIVSQSPYITRTLDWLGLAHCIVGVSRYDEKDLPRTGGVIDPDVDAIALLEPQLMITSNWTKEEVWRKAAPPALATSTHGRIASPPTGARRPCASAARAAAC